MTHNGIPRMYGKISLTGFVISADVHNPTEMDIASVVKRDELNLQLLIKTRRQCENRI
jgi:hypothetical protein